MSAIDRDIIIKKYINPDIEKFHNSDVKIVLENLKQNILKMPSVDKPLGEWIDMGGYEVCKNCHEVKRFPHWNFCPNCGRRMKGVNDE